MNFHHVEALRSRRHGRRAYVRRQRSWGSCCTAALFPVLRIQFPVPPK